MQNRSQLTHYSPPDEPEWLSDAFRWLACKLLPSHLAFSASSYNQYDLDGSFATQEPFQLQQRKTGVDLILAAGTHFVEKNQADHWFHQCKPAGILCLNFYRKRGSDILAAKKKLEEAGFTIEIIIHFGFFSRILSFLSPPLWIIKQIGSVSAISRFGNSVCRSLFWLELPLHPYIDFLFGEGTLILAKREHPPEHSQCQFSVVVPAYNEAKRIRPFLESIIHYFNRFHTPADTLYEIIVVDDGSEDNTKEVVADISEKIRYVRLYRNFGKGGAIKEGVRLAHGEKILFADADGATPIGELPKLDHWIRLGRDVVIGSRYLQESNVIIKQSLLRRMISRGGNFLIRNVIGLDFKDTQCGFKLFPRAQGKILFRDLKNLRFGFDFEILKRARQMGFTIEEVPVEWHDRQGSKVSLLASMLVVWDLFFLQFGYLMKFSVAGVVNTFVDYSVHNVLILFFGHGSALRLTMDSAAGFIAANIVSYLFNSGFTFRTRGHYIPFFSVSLVTFILSMLSYYGLTVLFNPMNDVGVSNLLKLSTVLVSLFTNYFGYKLIVFHVN